MKPDRKLLGLLLATATATAAADDTALKQRIAELEQKVDALAATQARPATASSATRLGAYGELHYNNVDGSTPSFDFHRFVLLLGHRFSDSVRFWSELEVEHAISGDGKKGEVALEQAYIDWAVSDRINLQGGILLQPVGFINETHEPDRFYGVERPIVAKDVLPTTWASAGAGARLKLGGQTQLDLMVSEGLYDKNGLNIRKARQKSAETRSESLGWTARIKTRPFSGLDLGASLYYQDDLAQKDRSIVNKAIPVTLLEGHAEYKTGPFKLRVLYAQWNVGGDAARNANRDIQRGWYVEPSYKLTDRLGAFVRYSDWYTDADDRKDRWLYGVNYWIHPNVVLKADVQNQKGANGFNLAVGYSF